MSEKNAASEAKDLLKAVSPAAAVALASEFAPPGTPSLVNAFLLSAACLLGWIMAPDPPATERKRSLGLIALAGLLALGVFAAVRSLAVVPATFDEDSKSIVLPLSRSQEYERSKSLLEAPDDVGHPGKRVPPRVVLNYLEKTGQSPWSPISFLLTVGLLWATLLSCVACGSAFAKIASEAIKVEDPTSTP